MTGGGREGEGVYVFAAQNETGEKECMYLQRRMKQVPLYHH